MSTLNPKTIEQLWQPQNPLRRGWRAAMGATIIALGWAASQLLLVGILAMQSEEPTLKNPNQAYTKPKPSLPQVQISPKTNPAPSLYPTQPSALKLLAKTQPQKPTLGPQAPARFRLDTLDSPSTITMQHADLFQKVSALSQGTQDSHPSPLLAYPATGWLQRAANTPLKGNAAPKPIRMPKPIYPQKALQAGIEGSVHLRLNIDAAGKVTRIDIIASQPAGIFETAAKQAAKGYRFEPIQALSKNAPNPMRLVEHKLSFRLR